jgi:hypothetical protein
MSKLLNKINNNTFPVVFIKKTIYIFVSLKYDASGIYKLLGLIVKSHIA